MPFYSVGVIQELEWVLFFTKSASLFCQHSQRFSFGTQSSYEWFRWFKQRIQKLQHVHLLLWHLHMHASTTFCSDASRLLSISLRISFQICHCVSEQNIDTSLEAQYRTHCSLGKHSIHRRTSITSALMLCSWRGLCFRFSSEIFVIFFQVFCANDNGWGRGGLSIALLSALFNSRDVLFSADSASLCHYDCSEDPVCQGLCHVIVICFWAHVSSVILIIRKILSNVHSFEQWILFSSLILPFSSCSDLLHLGHWAKRCDNVHAINPWHVQAIFKTHRANDEGTLRWLSGGWIKAEFISQFFLSNVHLILSRVCLHGTPESFDIRHPLNIALVCNNDYLSSALYAKSMLVFSIVV